MDRNGRSFDLQAAFGEILPAWPSVQYASNHCHALVACMQDLAVGDDHFLPGLMILGMSSGHGVQVGSHVLLIGCLQSDLGADATSDIEMLMLSTALWFRIPLLQDLRT